MNWRKATLALVLCLAVVLTGCISKVVTVEDVSKYVQLGQYTKTGDVVTFMVTIAITSKGSSTGVATITGFPYASRASSIHYFTTAQGAVTYTGEIITQMGGSATSVSLLSLATGTDATALTNSSFANTSVYRFCGSYLI